jgi:hypothetical protein
MFRTCSTHGGEEECVIGFLWENQKERRHRWWYGLDSSGPGWEPVEGSCGHGNEFLGCVKCWEILE